MAKMWYAIGGVLLFGVMAMAKADEARQTTRTLEGDRNETVEYATGRRCGRARATAIILRQALPRTRCA